MKIDLLLTLQLLALIGSVGTMFYKVISSLNKQSHKLEELSKAIKRLEIYENELSKTQKELIELKHEIKSLKTDISKIEESVKELKQEKTLLLEILKNTTKAIQQ